MSRNQMTTNTPPKFNSSPLKSYPQWERQMSSLPTILQGAFTVANFGGVSGVVGRWLHFPYGSGILDRATTTCLVPGMVEPMGGCLKKVTASYVR